MSRIGSRSLTRRRFAPQVRDLDGFVTAGAPTDTPFTGALQPMTGDTRQLFPEGVRESSTHALYTDQPGTIRGPDTTTGEPGDHVLDGAVVYVVEAVADWSHGLIPHDAVALRRLQERR